MSTSKEHHVGKDDTWKSNPMPGDINHIKGPNYLMILLILCALGILVAINFL